MEKIFIIEEPAPVFMDKNEFVDKTKKLLNKIVSSYSQSWTSRRIKDGEYPEESVCDKCTGCGTLMAEDGKTMECFMDREQGECFIRYLDYENFSVDVESVLPELFELLSVDFVKS